jgi:arylformamidase
VPSGPFSNWQPVAIAWVRTNAESFGGDPERLYIGGHSSGGHLCVVAMVTDWEGAFGLPADTVKGGLCMSGMYDLEPVSLSWRRSYIAFTDEMVETPEVQRQREDFAAAVKAAGKPVRLVVGDNYHHVEMVESLGNAYGPNGRAALALMGLAPA